MRTDLDSCVEDLSRPRGRDRYVVTRTRTYEKLLLATPGCCAIDFETAPREARAHERQPCVLSLAHSNGGTAVARIDAGDLPALFAGRRAALVAHNSLFETEILLAAGVAVDVDCTLLAAKCLYLTAVDEDRPQPVDFSLAGLVARELGRQRDKTLQGRDWRAPLDAAAIAYCEQDAVDCLALWRLYEQRLVDSGLAEGYRIIARAALPTAAINLTGLMFDADAHAALVDSLQAEADRLEVELATICGGAVANPGSMQQVGTWIMDAVLAGDDSEEQLARFCARLQARCGVGWRRGKNGHLAITKSIKAKMAVVLGPEYPIVASYLRAHADWTKAAKLLNAFGESLA
jgi:3'-5' exonuclease